MSGLPDVPGKSPFLSRKILGVQVLYWLAIGVLILAYVAYRMRNASADLPPAAETDPSLAPENADESAASYDGFTAQPTPTYSSGVAPSTTVETNESWAKKATEFVGASGLATYGDAQLAIQKYLNGDQLSFKEGQIRDAAIKQFGAPPEAVTVGGTDPKPAAPATAAKRQGTPPCYHTIRGANDNTYSELSQLYYGTIANDRIDLLQAANISRGKSGPWPVGTRMMIPAYHPPKYYTSTKTINTLKEIAAKNSTSVTVLRILNDGIKDTLKTGTKVRVA
jgi:hypothetical protein